MGDDVTDDVNKPTWQARGFWVWNEKFVGIRVGVVRELFAWLGLNLKGPESGGVKCRLRPCWIWFNCSLNKLINGGYCIIKKNVY